MRLAIILTAALLAVPAVAAPASYEAKLQKCRANAAKADADPTKFFCDWFGVTRGAPGGALTGRFSYRERGSTGTMTILEGGDGPAKIGIVTVHERTVHTCTIKAEGRRGNDDALVADAAGGCKIRIVSSGNNTVRVSGEGCTSACGARGVFTGTYRLTSR